MKRDIANARFVPPAPTPLILDLLRDEAAVTRCSEYVEEELLRLEERKRAATNTRPPFGILATRNTRNIFAGRMAEIEGTEGKLDLLSVRAMEAREEIARQLVQAIDEILEEDPAAYRQPRAVIAAVDAWEALLPRYFEELWIFTRDLGLLARAVEAALRDHSERRSMPVEVPVGLRTAAVAMVGSLRALDVAAVDVQAAAAAVSAQLELDLPRFEAAELWLSVVEVQPTEQARDELLAMEAHGRELITVDVNRLKGSAAAARSNMLALVGSRRAECERLFREQTQDETAISSTIEDTLQVLALRYNRERSTREAIATGNAIGRAHGRRG